MKTAAIIAVLVAISIPIFSVQLEKAREAVDEANIRDAYAVLSAAAITGDVSSEDTDKITYKDPTTNNGVTTYTATVSATQTQANWQIAGNAANTSIAGKEEVPASTSGWTVSVSEDGTVEIAVASNTSDPGTTP